MEMQILVGYDGSNAARAAVDIAMRNAGVFGAGVHVAFSMEKGTDSRQKEIAEAESALEYVRSLFDEKGIDCETHLLIRGNSPGEDLVQFAVDNRIDEIVIGVRRRSKVGKLLMGSTAQYVILKAPCPVVAVK